MSASRRAGDLNAGDVIDHPDPGVGLRQVGRVRLISENHGPPFVELELRRIGGGRLDYTIRRHPPAEMIPTSEPGTAVAAASENGANAR